MRKREENPFENKTIANEWIKSIEREQQGFRDKDIYPRLIQWKMSVPGKTFLDIGSGQGLCSEKIDLKDQEQYIGVEPSKHLLQRAKQLYQNKNRKFILGNAYNLPIESESIDGAFSVAVWFHLKDIKAAAKELNRVLKKNGKFLIITADPEGYKAWEALFSNYKKDDEKIIGKVRIPVNPLSKNVFYFHPWQSLKESFDKAALVITKTEVFGLDKDNTGFNYFMSVYGFKS